MVQSDGRGPDSLSQKALDSHQCRFVYKRCNKIPVTQVILTAVPENLVPLKKLPFSYNRLRCALVAKRKF